MNTNPWIDITPENVLNIVEKTIGQKLSNLFLTRNSYINRVFELEIAETKERIIVKFYRSNRWTKEMIQTEHDLLRQLYDSEILVIPPSKYNGETLFSFKDISFAVFPKKGGRAIDELGKEQWVQMGRLIGRMHTISHEMPNPNRITWRPSEATEKHVQILKETNIVPEDFQNSFFSAAEIIINKFDPKFNQHELILLHGDCHKGNFIHRPGEGIYIIDFDDMCIAPIVQDMWLLLPDTEEKCENEINWFIEGYQIFQPFPKQSLELIPALRAMRLIHFASWCATQYKEAYFRSHFPEWGSIKYWNEKIRMLQQLSNSI
jgi:Ser/Thr protein kinase RdoA (MazF antagonist)